MRHSVCDDGCVTVLLSGGLDQATLPLLLDRLFAQLLPAPGASNAKLGIAAGAEASFVSALQDAAATHGADVVLLPAAPQTGQLLTLSGLVVGDGDAATQLMNFSTVITDLRGMIHRGASYFGVGSGAAIAAESVLLSGNELGGVLVAPPLAQPDGEVEFAPGLGLIDLTVLPHAARLGRIGLGVAVIEAGLIDRIVALDDAATLVIGDGRIELFGVGSMWQLEQTEHGVLVQTRRAEEQ